MLTKGKIYILEVRRSNVVIFMIFFVKHYVNILKNDCKNIVINKTTIFFYKSS